MHKYNPKWGSQRRRTTTKASPCRPQILNLLKLLIVKGVREVPGYGECAKLWGKVHSVQYIKTIDQDDLVRTLVALEKATEWPERANVKGSIKKFKKRGRL